MKSPETFTITDKRGQSTEPEAKFNSIIKDIPRVYEDPRPPSEYVLIKQGVRQTTYGKTTIYIPEIAQQSPNVGAVVAVGRKVDPEEMKVGDLVTFGRYNAEAIDVDGETFQLVHIADVKLIQAMSFAVAAEDVN